MNKDTSFARFLADNRAIRLGRWLSGSAMLARTLFGFPAHQGNTHMQESLEPRMWCACRVCEFAHLGKSGTGRRTAP